MPTINDEIRNKYVKLIELAVLTFTAFLFIFTQMQSTLTIKISLAVLLVMIIYCVFILIWNLNLFPALGMARSKPIDSFLLSSGELIAYLLYLASIIFMGAAVLI
jgi:hypothetical protein